MSFSLRLLGAATLLGSFVFMPLLANPAQDPPEKEPKRDIFFKKEDEKGPRGPGGFGGPMMGQRRNIVKDYDKDGDGRLNLDERKSARESLKKEGGRRGPFGKGGFPGRGNQDPPKPGPQVAPADVKNYPKDKLYEPTILRTIFLQFEGKDWEAELADFYNTDVEVPARMTVDGQTFKDVGVHFRGMSSFMGVSPGFKRSFNVSMDFVDPKQRLYGYKTLNLLNSHDDPSYLNAILYSQIAREHMPAAQANLVKVVINGESWGIYVNVQQVDNLFLKEHFKSTKGTRWKVSGSPGGRGGLEYTGENIDDYKRRFEVKSGDNDKAWKALINLCKVLNQTPVDQLEEALKPIMDIDSLLWFLAIDCGVINCDGYWIRASDYNLYLDGKGKFHVMPHDINECFRQPMGPGMGGNFAMLRPGEVLPRMIQDMLNLTQDQKKQVNELQKDVDTKLETILTKEQHAQMKTMREGGMAGPTMRGPGGPGGPGGGPGIGNVRGVELDPLVGMEDTRKPLRSKVLAVPKFREQYLRNMKTLAEQSFDWKKIGPLVAQYRALVDKEIEIDTRKLDSIADFRMMTADGIGEPETRGPGRRPMSLKSFFEQRSKYLSNHPEIKKLTVAAN